MTRDSVRQTLRAALGDLRALAAERAEREERIRTEYETASADLREEHEQATEALEKQHASTLESIENEYTASTRDAEARYRADLAHTEGTAGEARRKALDKADENDRTARKRLQEAIWLAETVYEGQEKQPQINLEGRRGELRGKGETLEELRDEAAALLRRYRQLVPRSPAGEADSEASVALDLSDIDEQLDAKIEASQAGVKQLEGMPAGRLLAGWTPLVLALGVLAITAGIVLALNDWQPSDALRMPLGIAGGAVVLVGAVLYVTVRSRGRAVYHSIEAAARSAEPLIEAGIGIAVEQREREEAELVRTRDAEIAEAKGKYEPVLEEIARRRERFLDRVEEKHRKQLEKIEGRHEEGTRDARALREQRLGEENARYERQATSLAEHVAARTREIEEKHEDDFAAIEAHWTSTMQRLCETFDAIIDRDRGAFPDWSDDAWSSWTPPREFTAAVRFGTLRVDRTALPGGISDDERLQSDMPEVFDVPAMIEFPDQCSVLVQSASQGRDRAIATMQTLMLRLLTSLPPGKVRFTIVDPVGLGESFAGFMHLADHDGALVGERIWTESRHLEQRLADLTEHMENVIQKYLRNEFETIDRYNEEAGEIAEPYRFLVIADFPVNFTDEAAKRLASIINSGARCGVYTLIHHDTRQKLPQNIDDDDLRRGRSVIVIDEAHADGVWQDDEFAQWPLALDSPPGEALVTRVVNEVGRASIDASRVEVPFETIAPKDGRHWSRSTERDVQVPLGRSGATKLQQLALGRGTAQHALIAGKTGSGKSTLLHVLITNLSLWYSPDEVEFYLVDFKKGVEFKTYARHRLPHARVVAIETDREFGLSVLHRVDDELKRRGECFRELGVQDVAGFRERSPEERMPRVLLIIDEFQELFVEDDKLAQDASMLLDRLVRQGRAFGIHVVLGSQTLGGAYSLARSTLGQMAVRIALQCNEADSYLILSDDNAAARLLARPGEAIYNDAGGLIEGNSPFQISWLPDRERDQRLDRVGKLSREVEHRPTGPTITFEGNVPAELGENHLLADLLNGVNGRGPSQAWLGDAVAIKDPTAATFRRQSGANLIMVGQRDETALAITASSLISLAAHHPPDGARFYLLDGIPADSPDAGTLARLAELLPHETKIIEYRGVEPAMAELAEELQRRQEGGGDETAVYVIIHGLQRYRMLRAVEDFSFSMDADKPPSPDRQFGDLLTEGPQHAMHVLAWCDTMNNLNRTFDRQRLREFEMRVLFQMSAADSTNLIDAPTASSLGLQRALFYNEEQGTLEKFRPYAMPTQAWLQEMARRLREREAVGEA